MLKSIYNYIYALFSNRVLIKDLSLNDFKARYVASYLGILWAYLEPLSTVFVLWFVFQVGLRTSPVDNIPYILWILTGMTPWFFISQSWSYGTSSFIDYSYLVKKVVFKLEIIPLVRIISQFYIHIGFLLLVIVLLALYGYAPDIYYFQLIYYFIATFAFLQGITLICASLVVFLKDIKELVGIILQFGFWLTPIFWSYTMLPQNLEFVLKLNPIFYLTEGYRQVFIYDTWFWERGDYTLWFWIVVIFLNVIGINLVNRLKPHFADVL